MLGVVGVCLVVLSSWTSSVARLFLVFVLPVVGCMAAGKPTAVALLFYVWGNLNADFVSLSDSVTKPIICNGFPKIKWQLFLQ